MKNLTLIFPKFTPQVKEVETKTGIQVGRSYDAKAEIRVSRFLNITQMIERDRERGGREREKRD